MTLLRRLGRLNILLAAAVSIGVAATNSVIAKPQKRSSSDDPNSPDYQLPGQKNHGAEPRQTDRRNQGEARTPTSRATARRKTATFSWSARSI